MRVPVVTAVTVLLAGCSSGSIAHGPGRQVGPHGAIPAGPPSRLSAPRPVPASIDESAGGEEVAPDSGDPAGAGAEAIVSYPDGEAWVSAWVTRCGRLVAVVHGDGSIEEVPRGDVRTLELTERQRVSAYFGGGARAFPGRVVARANGLLQIRYHDGEEEWISPTQIESVVTAADAAPGRAAGASLCRGADAEGRLPIALVRRFEVRTVGAVVECAPGGAALLREGDGRLIVRASSVLTEVELAAGDRVDARFRGSGRFPAIVEHTGSGGAGLLYEDGHRAPATPGDVLTHFVPLRGRPRPSPAGVCPMPSTASRERQAGSSSG
jgi:hypothetical protein